MSDAKLHWLEWVQAGSDTYEIGKSIPGRPIDKIININYTSSRGLLPTATISLESGKRIELFNVTAIGYGVEMEREAE